MNTIAPDGMTRIVRPDLHAETTARLAKLVASSEPGTRLPSERELSETLGVGRSTVREAVRSLAFIGALQARQGDGMYVSQVEDAVVGRLVGLGLMIQRSKIHDVIELRHVLEVQATRMAAQRHGDADKEALQAIMRRMRTAVSDPRLASRLDLEFHVAIARASHNSVMAHFVDGMRSLFEIWMNKAIRQEPTVRAIVVEHEEVLEAMFARDVDTAAAHMGRHLERASERLLDAMGNDVAIGDYITSLLMPDQADEAA